MLTKTGFLLVSESGVNCCGFDYDYQNPEFDGCRMGQRLPMQWAIERLQKALGNEECCENWTDGGGAGDPWQMAEAFAAMIMQSPPFNRGSSEMDEFLSALGYQLGEYNRAWSSADAARLSTVFVDKAGDISRQ